MRPGWVTQPSGEVDFRLGVPSQLNQSLLGQTEVRNLYQVTPGLLEAAPMDRQWSNAVSRI